MRRQRSNNQPTWRRLLRSKLMLSVNLVLIGFIGWSLAIEVSQGRKVANDLNDLQKKIADVQGQNQNYSELLSRLDTPGFVDKEARLKLGYQKPGEQVLLLEDSAAAPSAADGAAASVPGASNPQKWWNYFFDGK